MKLGMIWAEALALLRTHREPLLVFAGLFLFVPQVLLSVALPGPEVEGADMTRYLAALQDYLGRAGPWLLLTTIIALYGHLLIYDRLVGPGGRAVGASFAPAGALLVPYAAASIVANLLTSIGLLFLILPGIYLAVRFALIGPVIVGEGTRRPLGALATSWRLTGGGVAWPIVLMLVIIFIVYVIAAFATTAVIASLVALASPDAGLIAQTFLDALFGAALSLLLACLFAAIWRQLAHPAAA